jgi:coproporphyrinogen III oxidase
MNGFADDAATLANDPFFQSCADYFSALQGRICEQLEAVDAAERFIEDNWERPHGGDGGAILGGRGCTRILEDGAVFERAGVGFSLVYGRFSEEFAARLPIGSGRLFAATGVSLVLHPRSPHIPTVHMNYRRLTREGAGWFGGGADLTPYYLDLEDARHFHQSHKDACDRHGDFADYAAFKKACDGYFHNHHRSEGRGIGGTFFDYLTDDDNDRDAVLAFVRDAGEALLKGYLPIARRHKDDPVSDEERKWQLLRRGRYVEFNLLHDRGTTFGIKTNGRVESILMSMPPLVSWSYRHEPAQGSREAELLDALKSPRDWLEHC